ncbi:TcpQ domain-containing protein [Bowmanella dokdonensis]|uniref:TcpQ domain-containing protein n=1 Tax=Bowmanella dokdonensis TaxID=751969 RepID=A0A939DPN8_9ALTE|nr:TcpQ domain-containing protein [Bowmanella dokdonensis]MBN7826668.1 TcpQ domain-containing protein [Bowmanella dokdonensis]
MKKRTYNPGVFWAKHLGLALALIVIAVLVINIDKIRSNAPVPKGQTVNKDPARGLSDFYAQYRSGPSLPLLDPQSDFVMDLNQQDKPLDSRLQEMESIQKPASGRWQGEHKYRTFKAGGTLREIITNYAQSEGMQVIWELNQDFVVKNNFQVEDTVIGTMNKIARAIDSNFAGTVEGFFCPRQRSLVITDNATDYLRQHCTPSDPELSRLVEQERSLSRN